MLAPGRQSVEYYYVLAMEKFLSAFDVQVEAFEVCDLHNGWRLDLPGTDDVALHYILAGEGMVCVDGGPPLPVAASSVVLVPPGCQQRFSAGQELREAPGRVAAAGDMQCLPLPHGLLRREAGNGKPGLLMACGRLAATYGDGTGVFDRLRGPVVECFAECPTGCAAFRSLLDELSDPRLGSRALAEAVMKQCLILVMRRLVQQEDRRLPWLAALEDPRLAQSVEAILENPEAPHRLQDLAALAGMSRASFSAHFINVFGQSPHDFLVESRMRRAAKLLQTTNLPIKTIAAKVGYRSRSNFTRAFKGFYGVVPAGARHKAAE